MMYDRSGLIDDMLRLVKELDASLCAFEMSEDEHSDENNEAKISSIKTCLLDLDGDIGDLVP